MVTPSTKRRRVQVTAAETNGETPNANGVNHSEAPYQPASMEEKMTWQGFCELDSEPALFNYILKGWGVQGVRVQELFGIDDAMISMLPQVHPCLGQNASADQSPRKPVYGLIFLFRYRSTDTDNQEASCPDHVWFANQTNDFACATVSLLNIVNNIPGIELGNPLQSFKDFTKDFTPAQRGDAIGNFQFVKSVHNCFTRKMDMLNIDLGMQNQFDDRKKKQKVQDNRKAAKSKKSNKKSSVITDDDYISDEAAFHFSAYVPIQGEVWKLDGLNRQPEKLGQFEDGDWLSTAIPMVESQMADYMEGQIEFVLFSLVKDPLAEPRRRLVENVRNIQAVHARLNAIEPHWRSYDGNASTGQISFDEQIISGPDVEFGITDEMLWDVEPSESVSAALSSSSTGELIALRDRQLHLQWQIRASVKEEIASAKDDERRARERMHDYGPLIYAWLNMLSGQEGLVKELIEEAR